MGVIHPRKGGIRPSQTPEGSLEMVSKTRKDSNHIGFELLLTIIAVSTISLMADMLHMTMGVDWAGCDVVTNVAHA